MLPNLPKLKSMIAEVQQDFLRQTSREGMGPALKDIRQTAYFEGNRQGIKWASGGGESREMEKISSDTLFHRDDGLEEVFTKLFQMGKDMGAKAAAMAFTQLGATLEKVGQSRDGKGKSILEGMYEGFESIQIPLGNNGELDISNLTFVVGPEMMKKMKAVEAEIMADPAKLRAHEERMKEILDRKKEEALAREANRKLVG